MTREEFKSKLAGFTVEGADPAALTIELIDDYTERLDEIAAGAEKDAKIAELTATIAQLNETNMKLIDRIKYQDETDPEQDPGEEVTLANLFE